MKFCITFEPNIEVTRIDFVKNQFRSLSEF